MMKFIRQRRFLFSRQKMQKILFGLDHNHSNVEDFLNLLAGRPIITNSSIQLLLKQAPSSIEALAKKNLSKRKTIAFGS